MKGNFHNSVPIASPVTRSVSYQFVFQQPLFEFLDCSNQYRTDVSTDSPEDLKYWMWDERVLRGTSVQGMWRRKLATLDRSTTRSSPRICGILQNEPNGRVQRTYGTLVLLVHERLSRRIKP
ncbi:hypothetical protein Y032_0123g1161 [Ancylostoma ceylanicum]|uniref:Uncharacterized protein n=1 Tax=Ancylostoma ceylanicum TaxID=53326 RepID=A0A016T9K3_9BILA|nr:hypothetical protein Y032_0123g1161 [Ancylostoma ceylanicum]